MKYRQPRAPEIVEIERLKDHADRGGRTLSLFVRPGSRSRPYKWFNPEDVPEFEGESAKFEIRRIAGEWRVVGGPY